MVKISDLRQRDVINVVDGRKLGHIKDIELDMEKGRVKAIVLPGSSSFFGIFSRNDEVIVTWDKIQKIGIDVILVELANFTTLGHDKQDY
ncbi:MAG: YlmC/YmxH family sporulation protein [Clostridia bacterium]|nr:YlmC/YmxH family sporulation protein [Clostridia bacterium]